ncbi:hypothetical protein D8B26_001246 [Coccidioides posadasii str. Silveira]|uniref:uncharacterized protein n=1 Tax=Coccidioides posadasii (strain RMSCC 757 / Silveira) TaxID=443226 RepID=UPI001BEDF2FD|nr:hypothetical protein D8B26_001246 [Coccidioides posadasii str. Silveira]
MTLTRGVNSMPCHQSAEDTHKHSRSLSECLSGMQASTCEASNGGSDASIPANQRWSSEGASLDSARPAPTTDKDDKTRRRQDDLRRHFSPAAPPIAPSAIAHLSPFLSLCHRHPG